MTPPFDPNTITLRLRSLVELHGTIPAVCELCGLAQPTLEALIAGRALPSLTSLICLCKGLGVSADWLLFGEVSA